MRTTSLIQCITSKIALDLCFNYQIMEFVKWLASKHPDLVTVEEAGRSVKGRAIPVLIITSPHSHTNKSVIFVEAGKATSVRFG